ncbi:MAG: hypothetical protein Q8N30_03560 [Methylococcales bacterium]|nr:hypothetical protein [Methylococcales bacterium]
MSLTTNLSRHHIKKLRYYFTYRRANCTRDGIDLDLVGWKMIVIDTTSWGNYAQITELGMDTLHNYRQADIQVRKVHHTLGERLAAHLRESGRITWENIEFKNKIIDCEYNIERWKAVRPDVFSILPSLNLKGANPCVHEVKVSRADFFSDLAKPEKREAYAAMSEAVYYVAPEGIITPNEVPHGYGLLIERNESEFLLIKRPRKRKVELQPQHYLNMIIKPGQYPQSYNADVIHI